MQFSVHRVIRAMTYSCYFTEQLNQLSTHVPVMPKVIQLPHTALFCHVILVNHCFDHAICRSVCMMSLHLGPIKVWPQLSRHVTSDRHRALYDRVVDASLHPSPQPKRHLDRFSRFCTTHHIVFLYLAINVKRLQRLTNSVSKN